MAIQTITYSNKQAMGTQPSVPEVNKITDSNMNEIKSVVNNNANFLSNNSTYSTTEQVVGAWIDGKPIYRKVVSSTSVSTGGESTIATGLSNVNEYIKAEGFLYRTNNTCFPLSRINPNNLAYATGLYITQSDNTVRIETGSNVTNISKVIVVLEYTKTTD